MGLEIPRDRSKCNLFLGHHKYSLKLLSRLGVLDCKTESTPSNEIKVPEKQPLISCDLGTTTKFPYSDAVGTLMYIIIGTRPDIAISVGKLAQFCESPTTEHWHAVMHLVRYVSGTLWHGILYQRSRQIDLSGYCDEHWGVDVKTRRSNQRKLVQA